MSNIKLISNYPHCDVIALSWHNSISDAVLECKALTNKYSSMEMLLIETLCLSSLP